MAKIVPSERLRRELDEVLAGVAEHEDPVEAVARLGARLIMQQALEGEVTEYLGRERYQRADGDGGAIYRNGYEPRVVEDDEQGDGARAPARPWRQRAGVRDARASRPAGGAAARAPRRLTSRTRATTSCCPLPA